MLEVRALSRPGLAPVDLDLATGEALALLGPSGSGKTLLLRAIADLDPNQGRVGLDGEDREAVPAPTWRRRVTYLSAEPGWWAERAGEHFPDAEGAKALLPPLGLSEDMMARPIAELSTGERHRLALVRVLVQAPRVLLLDEPTSGLDGDATEAVEGLIQSRLGAGASAIWVTHDDDQSRRLARRALVVADGAITETTA